MTDQIENATKNNLSYFKKRISHSILFPLVTSIIIASVLFFGIYQKSKIEGLKLSQQKLTVANQIFQTEISEKLAIIASSSIFFDFITSGEITRNEIMPRFLSQISTLHSNSVIGLKIWYDQFNIKYNIFENGNPSPTFITLKLCYSGNRLNNENGNCNYLLRLYFNPLMVMNDLKKINSEIQTCQNCESINLFKSDSFGIFNIADKSDFSAKLRITEGGNNIFYYYLISMVILIFFSFFNINRIRNLINKSISEPLENLVSKIKNNHDPIYCNNALFEINYLVDNIRDWTKKVEVAREHEKQAALGKLTAQVAHDIRSPLAALEMGIQSTNTLPEDIRLLIRNAVWRIRDIANNLLQVNKKSELQNIEKITKQLIFSLVNMIITEKRLQYRTKPLIEIESQFDSTAYGLFSEINISDFKRLLSNLINNAVEALNDQGKIIVSLSSTNNELKLVIADNGHGIDSAYLDKLGKRGASYNKTDGSGLGLYHAKTCIEAWGGNFNIYSEIGKGTNIILSLPKTESPAWFVSHLSLSDMQLIIVIDDDVSIHEIWKKRISQFQSENNTTIFIIDFYLPEKAEEWIKNRVDNKSVIYLCDYEFIGSSVTGLNLIEKLNIASQCRLVTSHFEDCGIISQCEKLGVGVIPKDLASLIPILKIINNDIDLILIDDDSLIRKSWKMSAENQNKKIIVFETHHEFLTKKNNFTSNIPIYIDSNLGNDIKGEIVSKEIYDLGFKNIYLTTGYDISCFQELPYIKGVVDKVPPWFRET